MGVSPFTFFRGTARIMASDLGGTPTSGLRVQLGGDSHLSNFGAYASPERRLIFDANDFDETLPGPWEWDVKRLAASFTVAASHLGFRRADRRSVATVAVASYRQAMATFATMNSLDIWYATLSADDVRVFAARARRFAVARIDRFEERARSRNSVRALRSLTVERDGKYQIRSDPPVVFPLRDLPAEYDTASLEVQALEAIDAYKATLSDNRRRLLDRFVPIDVGVKVVGVGSVGTICLIVLMFGRDSADPLFLQVKEANASVLEEFAGPSEYDHHGRRVVEGQRMVQAESDIFLGWTQGRLGRHFYVRQLQDWKGSVAVDAATPDLLRFYAQMCGITLARGHARSGDPVAIAAYLGNSNAFDLAVTEFAEQYNRQNMTDYDAFRQAIVDGRLPWVDPLLGLGTKVS
jgi:uncharacterized protein (DUF2252 family)